MPQITRSGDSALIAAASARAVSSASAPASCGVGDEDAAVGAHRQALADRVLGPLRAHRDEDHLAAVRLLELQALLDAALVAGVEDDLLVARERVVGLEGGARSWGPAPA